ncbi:hypothetical protein D3C85_1206050 [compost metagenome]
MAFFTISITLASVFFPSKSTSCLFSAASIISSIKVSALLHAPSISVSLSVFRPCSSSMIMNLVKLEIPTIGFLKSCATARRIVSFSLSLNPILISASCILSFWYETSLFNAVNSLTFLLDFLQ